jgi:predicted dehydrogenase
VNKIGVLGAGHLGKIHLNCILESEKLELAGYYDPDPEIVEEIAKKFGVRKFKNEIELIESCDIVDIVTPTLSHYACASLALKKFKHVFIEKPLTTTLAEARKLIDLSKEAGVKVQVGHVERFNPAFIATMPYFNSPLFIEAHRLSNFNPRGTDVPVILDLMIHDIDIILSVIKSPIKRVQANGVAVLSNSPDIANARIEFNNGCVANLTASRISMKNMRKSRFFQKDCYISVDYLNKTSEVISMSDAPAQPGPLSLIIDPGNGQNSKEITIKKPIIQNTNAILMELETFLDSIAYNTDPLVSIDDGYNSLELAYQIMDKIKF